MWLTSPVTHFLTDVSQGTSPNLSKGWCARELNGFWGIFLLHLDLEIFIGERGDEVKRAFYSITFCKIFVNSILMLVSICTQREFLIESKLNGFWGVLLLLLDLAVPLLPWFTHGVLYLLDDNQRVPFFLIEPNVSLCSLLILSHFYKLVLFFSLPFFSISWGMQTRERAHCARSVFPFIN